METIKAIRECTDAGGYEVETDKQTIRLEITTEQCCCENTGWVQSEDDLSQYIGAQLTDFYLTDDQLETYQKIEVYEGGVMFVTFNTNRGAFQLVVYNEHNGYYGHEAKLTCGDPAKNVSEYL